MRFNETETQLLLCVLHPLKQPALALLVEKLKQNEYIKGRLLNQLYAEIVKAHCVFNDDRDVELEMLLKRIKFKATPR